MKVCYFDCFSGAAGDMLLGAMLDAGASEDLVRQELDGLGLAGWNLEISSTTRGGIRAARARVSTSAVSGPRTLGDILAILEKGRLDERVRERAIEVFGTLVGAEARVHGADDNEIHLHEAGDDDALIDVVGSCAALESLAPDLVVGSEIALGRDSVSSAHGTLPVPGPAVLEILQMVAAPVREGGEGELTTPTGAALLATFVDRFHALPPMLLQAVGYGAGDREAELPNVVRILIGDATDAAGSEDALLLETNIDDMSPELLPYVIDSALAAGANDAWVTPVQMKKSRVGFVLSVLCPRSERDRVLDVIYRETTTLGVRMRPVQRDVLDRSWTEVPVKGHTVRVKLGIRAGQPITIAPEYEDAVKVARATGLPLRDVYAAALEAAKSRVLLS